MADGQPSPSGGPPSAADTARELTRTVAGAFGSFGAGVSGVGERQMQARILAEELRRIIDHLVQTDAPLEDLVTATDAARAFTARLAALPRRRLYEGISEASLAEALGERSFFDHGPIMGLSNPVAPPLVITGIHPGGFGPGEEPPSIEAAVRMAWTYEGPPASVHGGWLAALFDDVLGFVQGLTGNPGFTGTLTVRYRNPTPIDTDLVFRARVDRVEGRKIFTSGTCHAGDVLCAEAEGIFISIDRARVTEMMEHRRTTSRESH